MSKKNILIFFIYICNNLFCMEIYIASKEKVVEVLNDVVSSSFKVELKSFAYTLESYFSVLREDLWFVIETDYVDKVYRDSYYLYFSSKRNNYFKDCIKVSLFDTLIENKSEVFYSNKKTLSTHYLGFIILRPTIPSIIGRSIINPNALKKELKNFRICCSYFNSTSNSIKFKAFGFPHSSQESETITCAETALWSMMEYFGTKYSDYKPLLPSHIINILKTQSSERQIPSQGQAIFSLSYALKELGFGPKVYSRDSFDNDFESILKIYIESGIPIILEVNNRKEVENSSSIDSFEVIHHAILCIGRRKHSLTNINDWSPVVPRQNNTSLTGEPIEADIYDCNDINNELVFMDDNRPAYQIAEINYPTKSYCDSSWNLCKINHFVVPLYKKIYLEAKQAKDYFFYLLKFLGNIAIKYNEDNLTIRIFLTSSRSYKEYVVLNEEIDIEVKDMVSLINMGKFIWVAELSTKAQVSNSETNGLIILDATEPNTSDHSAFLIAYVNSWVIKYDKNRGAFSKINVISHPFKKFDNLIHIE